MTSSSQNMWSKTKFDINLLSITSMWSDLTTWKRCKIKSKHTISSNWNSHLVDYSKKIDNKIHSSIIVTVSSNDDVEIIKSSLNIEGIRCKSSKFTLIQLFTQCIKCQKFEHVQIICKNETKCEICVQKHEIN